MSATKEIIQKFSLLYEQAVFDVWSFFDREKLELISHHNLGWHPDKFDQKAYLLASKERYLKLLELLSTYKNVENWNAESILDVGGFFGAFPLTLSRIGFKVSLAEKYSYYYGAFDDLRDYLQGEAVKIYDADFTDDIEIRDKFDVVTNLAMLEHLPGSPKKTLENLKLCMKNSGYLLVEVPNIAYWPNRLKLLKGETVHPPIEDVYDSMEPFVGHHREYTIKDLQNVISRVGLECIEIRTFNYTPWPQGNWKQKLLLEYPINRFDSCKELLLAIAGQSSNLTTGK